MRPNGEAAVITPCFRQQVSRALELEQARNATLEAELLSVSDNLMEVRFLQHSLGLPTAGIASIGFPLCIGISWKADTCQQHYAPWRTKIPGRLAWLCAARRLAWTYAIELQMPGHITLLCICRRSRHSWTRGCNWTRWSGSGLPWRPPCGRPRRPCTSRLLTVGLLSSPRLLTVKAWWDTIPPRQPHAKQAPILAVLKSWFADGA